MSKHSVTHATFSIDRVYPASPARVFRAFSDPTAKQRWFGTTEGWETKSYALDFRVGGRETCDSIPPGGGVVIAYDARYQDIVPNERIVLSYEMRMGETRMSVSLATMEFKQEAAGTRLIFTEQGAYLDGFDKVEGREEGSRAILETLAKEFEGELASV
ncbi:SRPBCC family protein [Roseiterribacter gracilis]|uniref:Activator of HSP90 ATPase n=1 Tax=Roseiterribacter gracilis TaxID=2812848 RepID=A0A8S8X966_9PROT|nr:activator of HSP90 ATPase [Rhodospirillales bacterium TMPK1]